jgi:hypothetical protein
MESPSLRIIGLIVSALTLPLILGLLWIAVQQGRASRRYFDAQRELNEDLDRRIRRLEQDAPR